MSNSEEDRLLNSPSYQQKLATALADAAVRFIQEQRGG
jgi:N-acetylmuramoyl-L-alanine amidase